MIERAFISCFAIGLVLTSATQLRIAAMPVGFGELLLAVLSVISVLYAIAKKGLSFHVDGIALRLLCFWLFSFVVLAVGAAISIVAGQQQDVGASHDSFAYVLSACVTIVIALWAQSGQSVIGLSRGLVVLTTLVATALLLAAAILGEIGSLSLWYGGIRFTGWAKNPNQFALLLVGIPFLAAQLATDSTSGQKRLFWLGCAGCNIVVGIATFSDALLLAWVACLVPVMVSYWWRCISYPDVSPWRRFAMGVVLPIGAVGLVAITARMVIAVLTDELLSVYSSGDQGSLRLRIWWHGFEAAFGSPIFGWGPGAHSGLSAAHQGFESHNSYIDWAASAGVLGMLAYAALLIAVCSKTIRARKLMLFCWLLALMLFSAFHFVFRQPIFWVSLVVIYEYSRLGLGASRFEENAR